MNKITRSKNLIFSDKASFISSVLQILIFFFCEYMSDFLLATMDCGLRSDKCIQSKRFKLEQYVTSNTKCHKDTWPQIFYFQIYGLFFIETFIFCFFFFFWQAWRVKRNRKREGRILANGTAIRLPLHLCV